jgi:hypothetical protein
LLAVGKGASAQVRHPSTKLTAFENRELRFRRSLAFAYASAVISDQTRPVRAAEPPRDSFGSESFAGDYGLNPLFDAPTKTVTIEVREPNYDAFRRRFAVREFNPRIEIQDARGAAFNWASDGTVTSGTHDRSPVSL